MRTGGALFDRGVWAVDVGAPSLNQGTTMFWLTCGDRLRCSGGRAGVLGGRHRYVERCQSQMIDAHPWKRASSWVRCHVFTLLLVADVAKLRSEPCTESLREESTDQMVTLPGG